MHHKRGYILFLLFSILTMCTLLITLFFSRNLAYRNLMTILTTQEKCSQLALNSIALGQSMLYVPNKENPKESSDNKKNSSQNSDQILLTKVLPYMITSHNYILSKNIEGLDATIQLTIISENGKINLNTLYDFVHKKFVNEGQAGDRKKFCQWLFERIGTLTQKPSLFPAFEKHLKERSTEFNDVTELLYIKEFAEIFEHTLFYKPHQTQSSTIFLTDIFTIYSEEKTINPWLFSYSWRLILNLPDEISIPQEEQQKLISSFKKQVNWEKDWDSTVKLLYQKEYKDLPSEIKSMLTTEFEANIFSLLLKTMIGETTSTIFTILKANKQNKPVTFDIVKVYQL